MTQILEQMGKGEDEDEDEDAAAAAPAAPAMKAAAVFDQMTGSIGPDTVKKVKGIIAFKVTDGPGGATGTWVVDLKSGSGSITKLADGQKPAKKPNMTLTIKDDDLVDMASGKLTGQSAFMSGKVKIKGNMSLAMKLGTLFETKAKL